MDLALAANAYNGIKRNIYVRYTIFISIIISEKVPCTVPCVPDWNNDIDRIMIDYYITDWFENMLCFRITEQEIYYKYTL